LFSWEIISLFNFFDKSFYLLFTQEEWSTLCITVMFFTMLYERKLPASISALRYHGAKDLQINSRSLYVYWHLHLRLILLRFPRRTRARNSFPLSDRVLSLSHPVSTLIYRSVPRNGIRKRKISVARHKSCREQCASSSLQW